MPDDKTNPAAAEASAATEASKGGLPAETPGASPSNAEADLASRARTEDLTGDPEEVEPVGETPITRAEFDDLTRRVTAIEQRNRHW